MKNTDDYEKLTYLENNTDEIKDNLEFLYSLLKKNIEEFVVLRILAYEYNEKNEKIFMSYLNNEEDILRVQAVDCLDQSENIEVLNILEDIINTDEDYLVRGYGVYSFYEVYTNIYDDSKYIELIDFLKDILKKEDDDWVLSTIYSRLYLLDEVQYLTNLIDLFEKTDDYLVKHVCMGDFEEILDMFNANIIKKSVEKEILETSKFPTNVKDKALKLLETIDKEENR